MPLDAATIERIYTGGLAEEPWRDVVEQITDRLGALVTVLAFRTASVDLPLVGVMAFRGKGRQAWEEYSARYPVARTFRYERMEPNEILPLIDENVVDPDLLQQMREEAFLPAGIGHSYALGLWDRGQPVAYVIWGTPVDHPLQEDEAVWLREVARPLARAVAGYNRMRIAELSSRLAADTLGRLEVGVIAIDRQNRVMFSNQVAERLVAECTELGLHDGRLLVANPDLAAQLEASRTTSQAAQVLGKGDSAIGLAMVPVHHGRDELGPGSRPERAIYLHEMSGSAPVPERLISALFGLSRAEAKLAALLCAGLTIREAGVAMGITENSARTYSKLAFSKLGVSRQAELVRRILSSVAIFGSIGAE